MAFPGTITLPPEHFAKVVEYAARSFKASGFADIVLIGDSGPDQAPMAAVAARLNREWARTPVRVHHIPEYYATGSAASRFSPRSAVSRSRDTGSSGDSTAVGSSASPACAAATPSRAASISSWTTS